MILQGGQRRDGGAEGRAFVRLQEFQRPVQDRGQDFAHQLVAGDAAGDGDARDLLPGLLVLANAQGDQVGQRFQSGPELLAGLPGLLAAASERPAAHPQRRFRMDERQHHGALAPGGKPRRGFQLRPVGIVAHDLVEKLAPLL